MELLLLPPLPSLHFAESTPSELTWMLPQEAAKEPL